MNRRFVPALLVLLICLSSCGQQPIPRIKNGLIDLTKWNFSERPFIRLNGEWDFYWMRLLSPAQFRSQENIPPPHKIYLPRKWNGQNIDGHSLKGKGYATFRLTINHNQPNKELAFHVMDMGTAYRIWVDGEWVMGNGIVGRNREESKPQYFPQIGKFTTIGNSSEVVIQVSNFHHRKGGVWKPILFGSASKLDRLGLLKSSIEIFLIGALVIMGLYHLGMYLIRREVKAPFILGIVSLLTAVRGAVIGERFLIYLFPTFNWEIFQKIEYIVFYASVTLFFLFLKSIFNIFSQRIARLSILLTCAFSGLVLITPIGIYSYTVVVFEIFTGFLCVYVIAKLIVAVREKEPAAILVLLGFVPVTLTLSYDMLAANELVPPVYITPIGLFLFILVESLMLSARFSNAFKEIESLSVQLTNSNKELTTAKERYQSLVDNATEGILVSSAQGHVLSVNPAFLKMMNYDSSEELGKEIFGFPGTSFINIAQFEEIRDNLQQTGFARALELDLQKRDGGTLRVSVNAHAVKNREDEIDTIEAVFTDITHQRTIEKYRIAKESAELTNQVKSEFLANISHELRTPMHAILGFAKLGQARLDKLTREKIRDYFSEIEQSGSSLLNLLDELLELSKLEASKIDYNFKMIQLTEAVQIVMNESAAILDQKNIKVNLNMPEEGAEACFDFTKIVQVVRNLVSNAIKFSDNNGVLEIVIEYQDDDFLAFSIADQGVGIPDDELEAIFDKFAQSSRTNKGDGGTGLGLAICKQIISDHKGFIWADKNEPKGSVFKFTLPRRNTKPAPEKC